MNAIRVRIGKDQVSLLNPPNEGVVIQAGAEWQIRRNSYGKIVLRKSPTEPHPEFLDGMYIDEFCQWINMQA